jgi:hypothetical protein
LFVLRRAARNAEKAENLKQKKGSRGQFNGPTVEGGEMGAGGMVHPLQKKSREDYLARKGGNVKKGAQSFHQARPQDEIDKFADSKHASKPASQPASWFWKEE